MKTRLEWLVPVLLLLTACGGEALVDIEDVTDDPELSVEGELGGCHEANCLCFTALAQAMNGQAVDQRYRNNLGPADAAAIFTGGGSENIPVTCRAVQYWDEAHPSPAWFERYFDVQLAAGSPALFGGEVFSNTYTALTVGNAVAVRERARRLGHAALVTKASRWLEAYFTAAALGAVETRVRTLVTHNRFGQLTGTANLPGVTLGLVGTRSYVNGHGARPAPSGTGLQGVLLGMALGHPQREFRGDLRNSPGFYGGLRAAVEATGYRLSATGRVVLTSRPVPAESFGLTEAKRAQLLALVRSGGAQNAADAVATLAPYHFACDLTVVRTAGGVISWWGTSAAPARPCNARKGGSWAVAKLDSSGTLTLVTRSTDRWGGGDMGTAWREGNAVCASSGSLPRLCVPFPPGAVVSELVLGRTGARCVSGACGGGPPPPPPPAGTFAAAYVSQSVPTSVAAGARFTAQVTMRNSGSATWSQGAAVRLGSQSPQDNLTWGLGRVDLRAGVEVAPGATHTFTFEATAPATPGTRAFQWRMVQEGVAWFGPATPVVNVAVR